jgi:hypothetical protein
MHKAAWLSSVVLGAVLSTGAAHAQLFKPELKVPKADALSAARKTCTDMFAKLKDGQSEAIAAWIVEQVAFSRDEASKLNLKNDFRSKLELVLANPPVSPYGTLAGYDLVDEAYVPGSDRYFRLTYMTYHQRAPLLWEFRFYVKPDGVVSLHYISWNETNPFEFLATSDMMLPRWSR